MAMSTTRVDVKSLLEDVDKTKKLTLCLESFKLCDDLLLILHDEEGIMLLPFVAACHVGQPSALSYPSRLAAARKFPGDLLARSDFMVEDCSESKQHIGALDSKCERSLFLSQTLDR